MDRAIQSTLEWWDAVGVDVPDIPAPAKSLRKPAAVKTQQAIKPSTAARDQPRNLDNQRLSPAAETSRADDPLPVAAAAKTLSALQTAMEGFNAGALSDRARQCVFARGNPEADLMIIGEAPGREDDKAGKPFVGPTGQLLDKMMAAIGLTQEQFYITHVVNWRPPQNRNPKAEEIELCRPFLNRHIELTAPKFILIVGGVSLTTLTGLTGIMKNRGQWQSVNIAGRDIPALPIYHPALLLKQPALKKDAWRDLLDLRLKLSS